jgi:all-trans-retinol dehydrogenase (NAD+)
MIEHRKGHLVTIGSAAGLIGASGLVEYCASKFACVGLHESIRAELFQLGYGKCIKTTLINPYYIDTGMFHGANVKRQSVLPILKKENVVNSIIDSISYETEVLYLPFFLNFIYVLKLLPFSLVLPVMNYFGCNDSMKNFQKLRRY